MTFGGGGDDREGAHLLGSDGGRTLELAAWTDRGTVRKENQDAWAIDVLPGGGAIIVLADGMGGHADGGAAAILAVSAAADRLAHAERPDTELPAAVGDANRAVLTRRVEIGGGMIGTTLVAAVVRGGRAVVANVGDSRAYLLRGGRSRRLTEDHSWVAEQVRAGLLAEDAERSHPRRNVVTRAITGDPVEADVFAVELEPGDRLLLCSDGVWEPLGDDEIARLAGGPDVASAPEQTARAALRAGSRDNVTVVVCHSG